MTIRAERLRAAADHFDQHPNLSDDTAAVHVTNSLRVQVHPRKDGVTHLQVFAAWVPTLTDCHPIDVDYHADGETVTLKLDARLVDGTGVQVVCLPDADELDLLAANVRMEDGATFPAELLLRLVDHQAAEAVPVGDAVTADDPAMSDREAGALADMLGGLAEMEQHGLIRPADQAVSR